MNGVLPAETAILIHFQSVRIVLLVFGCVVVALLALAASQSDFNSHNGTSRFTEIFFAFTSRCAVLNRADRKSKRLPRRLCLAAPEIRKAHSGKQSAVNRSDSPAL